MASRGDIIKAVCADNVDAAKFCSALVEWLHCIDDVADKDNPSLTSADLVRINLNMLEELSNNPFYQTNKVNLTTLLTQAFRAWSDSVDWQTRPDVRDRRAADVFKSLYHETIFHVAYLVGGWGHLSDITARYRHVDYDCKD